jgi:hypothetical protein
MEELEAAMQGESTMLLSRSSKLKDLKAAMKDGTKSGVVLTEFAEVMKEVFFLGYTPFFKSANIESQLTAAAWRHVTGDKGTCEAVLQEECKHMRVFESLKTMTRDERIAIFCTVLNSVVGSLAEKMADDVVAGGDYQQQQKEAQANGKFFDMVLGNALCFEFGQYCVSLCVQPPDGMLLCQRTF